MTVPSHKKPRTVTSTRRRTVGRHAAPFQCLAVMLRRRDVAAVNNNLSWQAGDGGGACTHGLENERKQSINLTLNDDDEVGAGGEGARGGRPLAKALGDRNHHLLQPVVVMI